MEIDAECVPCLLRRVIYETYLVDKGKVYSVIRESTKILGEEFRKGANSAVVATKVHKKVYEILSTDPYKDMKLQSTEVALKLYPRAEELVNKSNDKFKTAVVCSIIGNILDYGISDFRDPKKLVFIFDDMFNEGLGVDDTQNIKKLLETANNVLYFTDNCGEIVFDKLLLSQIKKYNVKLTIVAKGIPILTDATSTEIKSAGLHALADEVLTTNTFAVGIDFTRIDGTLKDRLENADLIICKGMANYESFSDTHYRPIVYMLRSKCYPVANSMNVPKDKNIAKLYI